MCLIVVPEMLKEFSITFIFPRQGLPQLLMLALIQLLAAQEVPVHSKESGPMYLFSRLKILY